MPIAVIAAIMPVTEIPTVVRVEPAARIVVDSKIVMRDGEHVITPESLNSEMSMIHMIAVHHVAVVKKEIDAIMRHKERTQVGSPKMIVGNEREIIGAEAKIHVERQVAVVI